jgi:hypothetical protein
MSVPLGNHHIRNFEDDRLIDRLVDGELAEGERRDLLLRLETEPNGWRRCAMGFLEAQSWRVAFGPHVHPAHVVPRPTLAPAGPGDKRTAWVQIARLAALAAAFVAAFAMGWRLHGDHVRNMPGPASASTAQKEAFELGAREALPVNAMQSSPLLDPLVKQWERRGYRAERQERSMSLELQDGRRLEIPVHEVRLQYVADRTY